MKIEKLINYFPYFIINVHLQSPIWRIINDSRRLDTSISFHTSVINSIRANINFELYEIIKNENQLTD